LPARATPRSVPAATAPAAATPRARARTPSCGQKAALLRPCRHHSDQLLQALPAAAAAAAVVPAAPAAGRTLPASTAAPSLPHLGVPQSAPAPPHNTFSRAEAQRAGHGARPSLLIHRRPLLRQRRGVPGLSRWRRSPTEGCAFTPAPRSAMPRSGAPAAATACRWMAPTRARAQSQLPSGTMITSAG
jgi:hypothetical protein